MSGASKFQAHCQKLAGKLSDEIKDGFKNAKDDLARIHFLYPIAVELKIELPVSPLKDIERSESLKLSGNKLFQSRNFILAIGVYNEALLLCPQNDEKGLLLHDILIANRSAVFFEMKEYNKVLKDVDLVKKFNRHPTPHKLYIRAGKACEALNMFALALDYYIDALDFIQNNTNLEAKDKKKQVVEVENRIKVIKSKTKTPIKENTNTEIIWEPKNITYPALSSKLSVKSDTECGRYIVAKEDIKAGEILAVEQPYVCVVQDDTYRTNCCFCTKSTNQPIVCEFCCQACYCNLECKNAANIFHNNECTILKTLFEIGISVNCLMALRMITHRSLDNILSEKDELKKGKNVVIYKSNDYYNVYNLVSHCDKRSNNEFIHYTFMSTYLLRLLKSSLYFGTTRDDAILKEDEAYIGSLILKHLQILQFNAHEIFELRNTTPEDNLDTNHKTGTVGAGIYPTLALFNHSCDPSVIRYTVGNKMVLRAIKQIKRNEGVYENYGPYFTTMRRQDRIKKMQALYCFECKCQACVEDWPLLENLDNSILRVRCECGCVIPAAKDVEMPVLPCTNCKKNKNILPVLNGLITLEAHCSRSENLFSTGKYNEAVKIIANMLEVCTKYLMPPFTDMIMLQQRLKSCLVHFGNKMFDYKN